jgi:general secretion pathway protein G
MAGKREAAIRSWEPKMSDSLKPGAVAEDIPKKDPPEKENDGSESRGFTLMELLVVIGIIALLASIVLASLNNARQSAKVARAKADLASIRDAIGFLETDSNQWPGHQPVSQVYTGAGGNEIQDLSVPLAGITSSDGLYSNWNGPYMVAIPLDPWGHPYFMDTDYDIDPGPGVKNAAVIGSYGPNGVGLNLYDSDDIYLILAE